MKLSDARLLASQAGLARPRNIDEFEDAVQTAGLSMGVDNVNGDWVLLTADRTVVARVH